MVVRLGVIGAGAWGINHVRAIASEPRCVLVGVADPNPSIEQLKTLAPSARFVGDADELLASRDIDALVIASPPATHATYAIAALRHGKHVLVEKPLATTLDDALLVEAAARDSRCVAMVGHLMVYHPALVRLRELLRSGALGQLHYLHSTRVNLGRIRRHENALWSFGPHDLSMIDYLIGRLPHTVTARGQCVLQQGIEDVVFVVLRFETGELAHIHLSWLNPRKERRLTLVCSQKMVEFDDVAADKLRIYDKGYDRPPEFTEYAQYLTLRDGEVRIPQLAMQEPLRVQLHHFLDCIEDRRAPTTDVASAIRVIRVLEAASNSLANDGVPVEIGKYL